MKFRAGFVSNSSSSSFSIPKFYLSEFQIYQIKDHIKIGKKLGIKWCDESDSWYIDDSDDDILRGRTIMDNFDMHELFEKIGVDLKYVSWGEY